MATMIESNVMRVPEIYPEHQEFWQATASGKLLIKKCQDCHELHHYPRAICPFCQSENVNWTEASGRGSIYTYSVMRKGTPYVIAFVTLDEGPRMMTNIVGCDADELAIGDRVEVVFKQSGDGNDTPFIACFTPVKK